MTTVAAVNLWGIRIGAVSMADGDETAVFQYEPAFVRSDIQVSPVVMPLRPEPYAFPALSPESFRGLPGLLADSLPDQIQQVSNNQLPKDLSDNLKRIERLAKHLRSEVVP